MNSETFQLISSTISVINNSGASYTITSPSLNYYIITLTGGEQIEAYTVYVGSQFVYTLVEKEHYTITT